MAKAIIKRDPQTAYNPQGYLPQTTDAYTALSIVRIISDTSATPAYVIRQTDIVDSQVVSENDSPQMLRDEAVDRIYVVLNQFVN